ncbi:MAG: hypothetical protein U0T81_00370 [Saprospiraceae bacterium]
MFYKDSSWYGAWTDQMKQFTEALMKSTALKTTILVRSSRNAMDSPGTKRTDIESSLEQIQEQSDLQLLKGGSHGFRRDLQFWQRNPYYHPLYQITPIYTVFHGDSTRKRPRNSKNIS